MQKWKKWCFILGVAVSFGFSHFQAKAGTIYDSPYVSFSPDGQAWTTNAGDQHVEWYAADGSQDVLTGTGTELRSLSQGEHYYAIQRTGRIPLSKWVIDWENVNCCHNVYPDGTDYHGVQFVRDICLRPHYSGWRAICADCGQKIEMGYIYMSRAAAQSINYLEMGKGLCYYYICPFNRNLEQGFMFRWHNCKAISANRYRVEYMPNTGGGVYGGYMQPSFHMYDNAVAYEGRTVIPQKRLNRNSYSRIGWEFAGWNTKEDGTGTFYADAEEIYNLCTEDYEVDKNQGNIKLYAMWKRAAGVLEIDPSGGTYMGNRQITALTRDYGSRYEINMNALKPPDGYTVSFDVGGGEAMTSVVGTTHFVNWEQISPFGGEMQGNCYIFSVPDSNTDRIAARYEPDAVVLPQPVKENSSFGGWYYDRQFTSPAGLAGDRIVPTHDMTLYAQWVDLVLAASDNYAVFGGTGAVDLSWMQSDGHDKIYKIYQRADGESWQQIYCEKDIGSSYTVAEQFGYSGQTIYYRIPYTGYYDVNAYGAQGGDYGSYSGGAGGGTTGRFWLRKGELLTVCAGGKNGYNGGGRGEDYANGGGCTTVYSDLQGLLMTAGGGGGAAPNGNGYAGGLTQSLVATGMAGESGKSGGGGGYLGGRAGELIIHNHVVGVCNHVHQGNPSEYGGCYTVPVSCGRQLQHVYDRRDHWYWGGNNTVYCPCCGADTRKGQTCIGHDTFYYNHVCPVHGKRENNKFSNEPVVCDAVDHYAAGCGMSEDFFCGYPYDGYVISSRSAYGGSSYVNTAAARYYAQEPGVQMGNGYLGLISRDIGYHAETCLDAVVAADRNAPDRVDPDSVRKTPVDEETILIQWKKPQDYGTVYYHMAESYTADSSQKICTSNITRNTLVSGIKGYYYCLDDRPDTVAEAVNARFLSNAQLQVSVGESDRYLHVRPVDAAGNFGQTTHIFIGGSRKGDEEVAWPVFTKQLRLQEGDNVYAVPGEKIYYVKCDGATPCVINFEAYLKGNAAESYQVEQAIIESQTKTGGKRKNTVYVPKCKVADGEIILSAEELVAVVDAPGIFNGNNNMTAVRSERNRNLQLIREFVPDKEMDGVELNLIPMAAAEWKGRLICSDYSSDVANGLRIIGDGVPPQIRGLDGLEEMTLLDRRDGEVKLQLYAEDALSGVREFFMEVQNQDNGAIQEFRSDETGVIEVNITEDMPVFSGDFTMTVYACDNVGNARSMTYNATEFDLRVEIERILAPHDPVFKQGESGNLIITTWGYAERVEVEFPQALTELDASLNKVYVYEMKQRYRQEEQYSFMIPLYAPEAEQYPVTVRAYKGDKMLELHPGLQVLKVEGTVLDEIRTRLR